jgi:hypothetical protein
MIAQTTITSIRVNPPAAGRLPPALSLFHEVKERVWRVFLIISWLPWPFIRASQCSK